MNSGILIVLMKLDDSPMFRNGIRKSRKNSSPMLFGLNTFSDFFKDSLTASLIDIFFFEYEASIIMMMVQISKRL